MKDERKLVDQALRGDPVSFEQLLHPYRQGILNMAFQLTGNLEDAKEICQEALIKVYKHLHRFQSGRSFQNWLFKILTNTAFDFIRKKKRHEHVITEQKKLGLSTGYSPEKHFLNQEIREKIGDCLQYLTPKEKMVFLLRDQEGFSIKETAMVMGGTSMSVRTHLSRARRKIRWRFEKIYAMPGREKEI
jgi:RNA polymerase sigma-70 factor (ECF subfamily)